MSQEILRMMSTLDIKINNTIIDKIHLLVTQWELRQQNPLALNSQMLGVTPIYFLPKDTSNLYEIFGLHDSDVNNLVRKIPTINSDWKVSGNPCNIFIIWLMHLGYQDISSDKTRDMFLMDLAKYIHYKFFTSLLSNYFPHGCNEKVMTATITNLSKKFDIIVYGSWKRVIEERCKDLISEDSIHINTFRTGIDDIKFIYILSDIQTRIRDKIKNIWAEYQKARDEGLSISSHGSVTTDREGEKVLIQNTNTFDNMIYNIQNDIKTERLFLDQKMIDMTAGLFSNISSDILRSALKLIVELAKDQFLSKELVKVIQKDNETIFVGLNILISTLIQKTYRYCITSGIDVTNKALLFEKVKNIYSSSRIKDDDILQIKSSIAYLVDSLNISRRETTISSLRMAVILYIMIKSFKYI